jgi:hypothetical protein
MARRRPTAEENEAEDLAIWLCRNPEAAAALDRWLNPDKEGKTGPLPEPDAGAQAEAETGRKPRPGLGATRRVPDPAAVAWWLRMLKIHAQGCIEPVPERHGPIWVIWPHFRRAWRG